MAHKKDAAVKDGVWEDRSEVEGHWQVAPWLAFPWRVVQTSGSYVLSCKPLACGPL